MASRFVRSSKYRHVFGKPTRKEQCYDNLHISKNAWDSNIIKVNPKYIAVNWEAGGGGAFAVIPLNERGKLPENLPLFRGHTAAVLDTDWNPFHDDIIASGSDDGKVFVWKVPSDFTLHIDEEPMGSRDVSPQIRLIGHQRKVGHVLFHPAADHVLATSSGDFTVKLWDVEAGQAKLTMTHIDLVQSMSFSADGSLMVTTCRDKKLRIWDPRQQTPVHEGPGHAGAKNSRAVWLGELDRVATTGFSRMSDRQLGLWDIRNANEPIGGFQMLDSISGVCMPFWDEGTKCLYLAGKGDGNIRYFEYANDDLVFLSEYKSADPQRGIAFVPKRGVDVHENEVMRAYKTVNDAYIEPISFIVPRRAETFQSDIYPETSNGEPGLSSSEWFDGKNALPPKFDLSSLYSEDGVPQTVTTASTTTPPKPEPAVTTSSLAAVKSQAESALATAASSTSLTKNEPEYFESKPESKPITTTIAEKVLQPLKNAISTPSRTEDTVSNTTETVAPISSKSAETSILSPVAEKISQSEPAVSASEVGTILTTLRQLSTSLESQARTLAGQQETTARLIKEVESIHGKLK